MKELLNQLATHRLVPVVAIDSAADAVPLAEALAAGGLPVAEITFRTAAAEESIRAIVRAGKMLVGAGTVLTVDIAKKALDAGVSFIVTPGFSPRVVEFCLDKKIPILPGTATATDMQAACEWGLSVVKFFPAEAMGGLKVLKALAAPFTSLKFMPTGGITSENLRTYLDFGQVLACGGSWMVAKELIAGKQFTKITELTRQAVQLAQQSRPAK
jgi:2-dehydro-3-deoxyphosphogluconate aldolase/(4S)-4-hydroxy-2-oxoglutarate aldolase